VCQSCSGDLTCAERVLPGDRAAIRASRPAPEFSGNRAVDGEADTVLTDVTRKNALCTG